MFFKFSLTFTPRLCSAVILSFILFSVLVLFYSPYISLVLSSSFIYNSFFVPLLLVPSFGLIYRLYSLFFVSRSLLISPFQFSFPFSFISPTPDASSFSISFTASPHSSLSHYSPFALLSHSLFSLFPLLPFTSLPFSSSPSKPFGNPHHRPAHLSNCSFADTIIIMESVMNLIGARWGRQKGGKEGGAWQLG